MTEEKEPLQLILEACLPPDCTVRKFNGFGVYVVEDPNRQRFVRMVEGSVLIYQDHYYLVLDQPDKVIDLDDPDGLRRLKMILQGLFGEDLK